MKRISKTKTIARAFSGHYTASEQEIEHRLSICAKCPYNSSNVATEDKTLLQKVRSSIISEDFCTACGCQIAEKVTQANEECGAVDKGEKPKWPRLVAETTSNYLNLRNLSPDLVNVSVTNNYEIYLGKPVNNITEFKFRLECDKNFEVKTLKPVCRSCTSVYYKVVDSKNVEVFVKFDKSRLKYDFNKKIVGRYLIGSKEETINIIIKGEI